MLEKFLWIEASRSAPASASATHGPGNVV